MFLCVLVDFYTGTAYYATYIIIENHDPLFNVTRPIVWTRVATNLSGWRKGFVIFCVLNGIYLLNCCYFVPLPKKRNGRLLPCALHLPLPSDLHVCLVLGHGGAYTHIRLRKGGCDRHLLPHARQRRAEQQQASENWGEGSFVKCFCGSCYGFDSLIYLGEDILN